MKKIGFVSTWFDRGAAMVTKAYRELLDREGHKTFIYARGGEYFAKGDPRWEDASVTWGLELPGTRINLPHFKRWIRSNNLDVVFFNEQHEIDILPYIREDFKDLVIGSYIDYYKEETIHSFELYDFLICNTKRHYSIFSHWHPQCFYVPWGTDTNLFRPHPKEGRTNDKVTFFHSVGFSKRKGTDILIKSFIDSNLGKISNLIIHTQVDIKYCFGFDSETLKKNNITVIHKTVPAPGLYNLGDIYVYPTYLDGLGLTIYEALSCGLPVITTNEAPMNEIVSDDVGFLVEPDLHFSRSDGYYWPMARCDQKLLTEAMLYFIKNSETIKLKSENARAKTESCFKWVDRQDIVSLIFNKATKMEVERYKIIFYKNVIKKQKLRDMLSWISVFVPDVILSGYIKYQKNKKLRYYK